MAFTLYTPGLNPTTHPGLKATCFFTRTEGDIVKYYFGTNDGYIHQMAVGHTDNGLGIACDIRLPWLFGKDPISPKVFHSAYFHVLGNGNNYNVTLSFEYDLQVNNVVESIVLGIAKTDQATWDNFNWDEVNWGNITFETAKLFPKRRANYGRYGIQNQAANEPIALTAITSIMQTYPVH